MEYQNIGIKKLGGNVVEIEGEITIESMKKYEKKALDNIRKDFEIQGFRKGHAPDEVIKKNIDNQKILEEAANLALGDSYPLIIQEHKLEVIGTPRAHITKIAPGNPLGFKITVGLIPKVKLPDYKKIASQTIKDNPPREAKVSEEEIERVAEEIKKMQDINELNDETVKKVGPFQNLKDFKEKINENLTEEKKIFEKRKIRDEIAKKLVEKSELEIPEMLVEEELIKNINYLNKQFKKRNTTIEEYLKQNNKTEEQFIKEKKEELKNQIKTKFIIEEIAQSENIKPNPEEVEKQAQFIQAREQNADPVQIKAFASAMLTHEKTFRFLESHSSE